MNKDWNVNFRLICAEPSVLTNFRLKPKDRVEIALAGQVVVAGGYIVNRQTAYDANRHAVQIDGYSKAGQLAKVSINEGTGSIGATPRRHRKLNPQAIRDQVPHGGSARRRQREVQQQRDGCGGERARSRSSHGSATKRNVAHLRQERRSGCRWREGRRGNSVTFVEGQNILAANASISMPYVDYVIVGAQHPARTRYSGRRPPRSQAKATMTGGPEGHSRKLLAEMPLTENEAKLRTDMEVKTIQASLFRVTITYAGWLKPGIGGLWDLGDVKQRITVKSPMLLPSMGANGLRPLGLHLRAGRQRRHDDDRRVGSIRNAFARRPTSTAARAPSSITVLRPPSGAADVTIR